MKDKIIPPEHFPEIKDMTRKKKKKTIIQKHHLVYENEAQNPQQVLNI